MDTAAFVDLLLEAQVLRFGDFTTKSGRATPYFLDFGALSTGAEIAAVGRAYADHVVAEFGDEVDLLFGPAYKAIPLVVATAVSLVRDHGVDVGWAFNRKEPKDHGEGGLLVGHAPADGDRVVIVEDVTTAGTSIRETVPLLRAAAAVDLAGLVVSVDRRERGTRDDLTALDELAGEFDLHTTAITSIDEIAAVVSSRPDGHEVLDDDTRSRLAVYRRTWGVG